MGSTTVLELGTKLGCVLSPDGTAESYLLLHEQLAKGGGGTETRRLPTLETQGRSLEPCSTLPAPSFGGWVMSC